MACPNQDCPCGDSQIEVTHLLANDKTSAGQSLDSSANNVRHDELLARIAYYESASEDVHAWDYVYPALRAVVELHRPQQHCLNQNCWSFICFACNPVKLVNDVMWPCPTIQAIEKELS